MRDVDVTRKVALLVGLGGLGFLLVGFRHHRKKKREEEVFGTR